MRPAIETTSYCNHKCIHCPFQHNLKDKGNMEWDTFTKLVDELAPQAEYLQLFNRGEPFMHPRIYEMIEYAQSKCKIVISTNAAILDPKKLYEVFKEGILCVSFPAGDRATYNKITNSNNFDKALYRLRILRKQKPEGVELYTKMVRLPENEGHEPKFDDLVIVENSNQNKGYTACSQPDITPTWNFKGKKVVCCRDFNSDYDWETYAQQGRERNLNICRNCGIQ